MLATTPVRSAGNAVTNPLSPWGAAAVAGTALPDAYLAWACYGQIPRRLAEIVPAVRKGLLTYDVIGTFPLVKWRAEEKLPPGPLLTQPEDWCPVSKTLAATVRDLVLYEHAWWLVQEREWTGFPSQVQRLDPSYVSIQTVPGAEGEPERTFATYRGREVPQGDLIRFDGPDEGLLALGAPEILTALRLESAADRYASPEVPTGVLKGTGQYQLTNAEIDEMLSSWQTSRMNSSTAYLGNAEYQVIEHDPTTLQLVESREESALQLARLLGLPPRYVGASSGDSMTYSNVAEERRDLVDLSYAPYMSAIEQRLSMSDRNGTPRGTTVRFDLTAFLRGSPAERASRAATLIPLGVMTPAEARGVEPDLSGPPPESPAVPAAQPQGAGA